MKWILLLKDPFDKLRDLIKPEGRSLKRILFIFLLLPIFALASTINVYPLSIEFAKANQRYKDITVYNTGKSTAYVNVNLVRVLNPGNQDLKVKKLRENPSKFGMIASPNKLIIPHGQSRIVRVLRLLHGNKNEAVYHVNITPATGVLERIKTGNKAIEAGVRVIVGYNINVRVLPKNAHPNLIVQRKGNHLTFINKGNSSVLLYRGKICPMPDKCTTLPTKRMYSGLTWSLTLPSNSPFEYTEQFIGKNKLLDA